MYYGTQDPGKGPKGLCNAQEFADLQWLVYRNDGTTETHPVYGPSSAISSHSPIGAANTNWYDEITHTHQFRIMISLFPVEMKNQNILPESVFSVRMELWFIPGQKNTLQDLILIHPTQR